ncbi:uncharacterized protein LACBIDRAFT_310225 [Laccaria bicolor S238N-H82]|uniref:Predicted protein n=1 Tax=Laccaria bicolor (strain S238N-H82 / ATCC MYA-4686) TaxID=486041 RepID=B0DTR5_LACBS|nr:uncharacterized protein LACBIDRAFT_310225 [Laccaria bicolor S238N-H82]EDR01956.1 predicted protein [Laccaria bicolor S238N-H82]|eukprot:XP_001887347.1 predicted protein [Laccaria bicolor S238N-H82]
MPLGIKKPDRIGLSNTRWRCCAQQQVMDADGTNRWKRAGAREMLNWAYFRQVVQS